MRSFPREGRVGSKFPTAGVDGAPAAAMEQRSLKEVGGPGKEAAGKKESRQPGGGKGL